MSTSSDGPSPVFDLMAVLSDAIRCRLLLILEAQELSVSEICAVLQLPQSTVSRHLKVLADSRWLVSRRDRTSRKYLTAIDRAGDSGQELWRFVRAQILDNPAVSQDRFRLADILAARREKSQDFFSSAAGHWSHLRQDLFGNQFELAALPGLLHPDWVVGDLGCGTGQTTASIAPFVRSVVGVDDSEAMLTAAKEQLDSMKNIDLRLGRLEALPLEDESLDAAVMMLVLHHLPEPERAIREVGRVLKSEGACLLVDMLPHDREEYRQEMGHLWLGFEQSRISEWLQSAGLNSHVFHSLPTDPEAKGPALFAASGRKTASKSPLEPQLEDTGHSVG